MLTHHLRPAQFRGFATAFLCGCLIAACTDARLAIITPPAELLTCKDEPRAPSLPPVDWASVETARPTQLQRDRDTLAYVLAWREAWGSCHATVAGVKAWAEALK